MVLKHCECFLLFVEIVVPHVFSAERALFDKLPRAKAARWDYVDIEECLEGTRSTVLAEIKEHISNGDRRRIQWLNGLVGTGKSTVVKTVAHSFTDENQLGASFFWFVRWSW